MSENDSSYCFNDSRLRFLSDAIEPVTRLLLQDVLQERVASNIFAPAQRHLQTTETGEKPEPGKAARPAERSAWTIVVQLASGDVPGENANTTKLKQLEQLAEKTKGTGVTFVVQTQAPGQEGLLERYVIHDGRFERLPGLVKSQGIANDTKSILQFANQNYPADKLGLVLHTHGLGSAGVGDPSQSPAEHLKDKGKAICSLPEMATAIKEGLKGSSHDRLDVLDFDCCREGTYEGLGAIEKVAKHVVASERPEHSTEHVNENYEAAAQVAEVGFGFPGVIIGAALRQYGKEPEFAQPLGRMFEKLLRDPKMDGGNVADMIVDTTREQYQRRQGEVPVDTLAHYDLSQFQQFQNSLDNLGLKLLQAMNADPKRREEIRSIVAESASIEREPGHTNATMDGVHDLGDFCRRIVDKYKDSEKKEDKELVRAAQEALDAERKLVSSHYEHSEYKDFGGLAVSLPEGPDEKQAFLAAKAQSMEGRLYFLTDGRHQGIGRNGSPLNMGNEDDRTELAQTVFDDARLIQKYSNPASEAEKKQLEELCKESAKLKELASDREKFEAQLKKVNESVAALMKSDSFNERIQHELVDREYLAKRRIHRHGGGWDEFRQKLVAEEK